MNHPINIDITMTATLRPKVLRKTLRSFEKYAFGDTSKYKCRLVINIDPIGELLVSQYKIKNIAKNHFPNVLCNISDTPSFPKALIWCWSHIKSNYVFHLEDDWRLNRFVPIDALIYALESNKKLASIRLSKSHITKDIDRKLTFNPSMFKKTFLVKFARLLDSNKNPEKQVNSNFPKLYNFCNQWEYEVFGKVGDRRLVTDIGRKWMQRQKFIKLNENNGQNSSSFTTWEKKC